MSDALQISEISLLNAMRQIDMISHNLANVQTTGYKRDSGQLRFEEVFQQQLNRVPQLTTRTDFSPGAFKQTGNPLDLAIEGAGFFEFRDDQGLRYARAGSLTQNAQGQLIAKNGMAILGEEGEIWLAGGDIAVSRDGSLYENGEYIAKIRVVQFSDVDKLQKLGEGVFAAPQNMPAESSREATVRQGYQEASNVNAAREMINMMVTLRQFESSSQVIKSVDEMLNTAIATIAEF